MLPLGRNGYSDAAVMAALVPTNGARTVTFRYDLLDATNTLIKPLASVLSGSLKYDSTATIQRTLSVTLIDDPAINWLQDRIKPWTRILMPDGGWAEFPTGVFLLSTPQQTIDPTGGQIVRTVSGYDLIQVLTDWKTTDRYAVSAGTLYTSAITTLLTTAGFTGGNVNLAASTKTLPATQEWPIGTPLLTIINTLLAAINYDTLSFDTNGVAQCQPHVLPSVRPSLWTYSTDDTSVVLPGTSQALDLFAVPNVFVLAVSDPTRAALRSVYTNSSVSSPTSTVNRGRSITTFDGSQTAPDQTTLDALAQRAAFNASQVYQTVGFQTLIMPQHDHLDVLTINQPQLGISSTFLETAWAYPLKAGAAMSHSVQRIVSV